MLMSSLLRPVAEAAREKNLVPSLAWAQYLTSSVKASIKGWAKVPMSNSLSSQSCFERDQRVHHYLHSLILTKQLLLEETSALFRWHRNIR